jgi:hypothetical protein
MFILEISFNVCTIYMRVKIILLLIFLFDFIFQNLQEDILIYNIK